MSINEAQLRTWSNPGASATAEATYRSIKRAIEMAPLLKRYTIDVYLQGSYGNGTNIHGNSDVDVVVELSSAYYGDTSLLPMDQREAYDLQRTISDITFDGFRDDVHRALVAYYGASTVVARNKCIEVKGEGSRLEADVVPCFEYHLYRQFAPPIRERDIGIKFLTRKEHTEIINFPKLHMANATAKDKRVRDYKPAIRVFKNWRDRLIADGLLEDGLTPSYFVECLCWNIPDAPYAAQSWQLTILGCLQYLQGANLADFMCQNNVTKLFGDGREQWNLKDAQTFRSALIADWNRGR